MERELLNKITKTHKHYVRIEDSFWNHIDNCEHCQAVTGKNAVEPKAAEGCERGQILKAQWIEKGEELDKIAGIN